MDCKCELKEKREELYYNFFSKVSNETHNVETNNIEKFLNYNRSKGVFTPSTSE